MDNKKYELFTGRVHDSKYDCGLSLNYTGLTSDSLDDLKKVIKILKLDTFEIRTNSTHDEVVLQSDNIKKVLDRIKTEKEQEKKRNLAIMKALNALPEKFKLEIDGVANPIWISRSEALYDTRISSRVRYTVDISYHSINKNGKVDKDITYKLWDSDILTADGKVKRKQFFLYNGFTPVQGKKLPQNLPDRIIDKLKEVKSLCREVSKEAERSCQT